MKDVWPYAANLKAIRGTLSVEKAAGRIDRTRGTWHSWEKGAQRPDEASLKRIVEVFGCPPELIGYEPPKGWELVPTEWIRDRFDQQDARLKRIVDYIDRQEGV